MLELRVRLIASIMRLLRRQQVACTVAAGRGPGVEQPQQRGHDGLRFGAVGDVLAGERRLVHLGAHVAGIERVDTDAGFSAARIAERWSSAAFDDP